MHIFLKCVEEHDISYCDNLHYLTCDKNDIVICDSFVILKDQTFGFGKNISKNMCGLFLINHFAMIDSTNVVNRELLSIVLKNQSNTYKNRSNDIPGISHRIAKKSVGVISLCFNCGENLMGPRQDFIHCTVCNQIFHEMCYENHKSIKTCHRILKNTNIECVASFKAANVLVSDWSNKEVVQWLCSINFFRLIDLFENKNITGKDIVEQMQKYPDELNNTEISGLTFWTQIADSFYRQALYEAFKTLLEPNSNLTKEYNTCDNVDLSDRKMELLENADELSTEKYIINVGNHKLRETSYTEKIVCCYCNQILLGLQKQGYHCIKCQKNFHKVCSFQINIQKCTESDISNEQNVSNSSIFGVSIGEQKLCSNGVPLFIKCCFEELERRFISNNSGKKLLDTYSQTATTDDTIYLKNKFSDPIFNEESDIVGLTEISDINLAKLIKLYFKELPEPLLTHCFYHSLVESVNEEEDKICCSRIHSILSELPSPNKQTLRFLMKHFELICSNIWDNCNKLKIVSKKWSLIFSKTLIWPPQIMVDQFAILKSRHQRIIQLIFEYKLVFVDRFTWPLSSVHEETMTSLSQSLNRIQLNCLQTAIEEMNNDITSQEWYWGNTSKEEVNEYMTGLQDGYFLVRDSSDKTLGMYTLTIRKEGENKLVRIICKEGLYGFQEPCQFESVPKLIKYYQSHKLSEYNDQLNIMLRFSCSKAKSEVKGNVNELYQLSNDDLIQLLIKTMNDILKLNSKVEDDTNTYNENQKQLDEVTKVLKGIDRIRSWCNSHVIHIMNINNSVDKSAWVDHSRKCLAQLNTKLNNCDQVTKEMNERREKLITESDELHSQLQMDRPELKRQNRLQSQIIRLFKDRGVPDEIFSSETLDSSFENLCDNEKLPESTYMDHNYLTLNIRQALNVNNPINIRSNWFVGNIERQESINLLSSKQHGTFLIRKSREPGNYALDINVNGTVQHCRIFCQNGKYGFIKNDCLFQSLEELVKAFHICSLSKYNPSLTTNLTYPVNM